MVLLAPNSAQENMDEDYRRLLELKEGDPIQIRIYRWRAPSVTYGYFTKAEDWLNLEALNQAGFDVAKRPTGGGILFHTHDLSFSVLIPKGNACLSDNTLDNYRLINAQVKEAIQPFVPESPQLLPNHMATSHFCMAHPTIYDVMIHGKKVGGAAQRRTKTGLLHQGTICLEMPEGNFFDRFLINPEIATHLLRNSFALQISHAIMAERLIHHLTF